MVVISIVILSPLPEFERKRKRHIFINIYLYSESRYELLQSRPFSLGLYFEITGIPLLVLTENIKSEREREKDDRGRMRDSKLGDLPATVGFSVEFNKFNV